MISKFLLVELITQLYL